MPGLRVRLFGRAVVEVNGQPIRLTPTTTAVLVRLVIAGGAPVTVDELYRDVWQDRGPINRECRTKVQRRILEIRETIDPDSPGEKSSVLLTERGRITAYRLTLTRDSVDIFEFIDQVVVARRAATQDRITILRRALDLWAGVPLADVSDKTWAAQTTRHLTELRRTATRDLMDAYELAGRGYDALSTGEQLSWDTPHDTTLAESLATLRDELRVNNRKKILREEFTDPDFAVVVVSGDLFAQEDANLVVGFCDTFDTDTDRDMVISSESAQGHLLDRVYAGDRKQLDRDLRTALARVPRAGTESRTAKRLGKLARYPVGTVATLYHARRRVFAVAYSRMGNDLVAQSSVPALQASLTNLWEAVYVYGQLKPIAMPLIGAGLSRVREASYEDLLAMIVTSFAAGSRRRYLSPELRIVVNELLFDKIRSSEILRSTRDSAANTRTFDGGN